MATPHLYLQLYSLRHETSADAEGTLRQVRALGFDGVELAGEYGWAADQWRALLSETGLDVVAGHVGLEALENDFASKLAFHNAVGMKRVVVPALPGSMRTADGYREAARRLDALGSKVRAEGLQFGYHNHAFEFDKLDGTSDCGMDILIAETDPALVSFEFDSFWLESAGRDAVEFVRQNRERVFLIHAKDLRKRDKQDVPAGSGDVDFRSLIPLCTANDWPVVLEYESPNAMAGVRQGAAYLRPLLG